MPVRKIILGLICALGIGNSVLAQDRPFITLGSTTSTEQSGLFAYLLPLFTATSGIEVRVVAVGTGQALKLGERGDVDLLLVHDPQGEEKFVTEGFGIERHALMHNDFIILGPENDPAAIHTKGRAIDALKSIASTKSIMMSRGDDSGTDRLDKRLWKEAGIDPKGQSWYKETGSGMGPTLNAAQEMQAYVLSDRATWLAFANKGNLDILLEGDPQLLNPYGIILVNPEKHSHIKTNDARIFMNWLLGSEGQNAIARYTINGQPLFVPDAASPPARP